MNKEAPKMPSRPKLRSSCDACGIAKVKCNREKPQCGRCASHHLECVYGVSRKMGKPPRKKAHDAMRRASLDYGDYYYRQQQEQQQQQQQKHQAQLLSRRGSTVSSSNDGSVVDLNEQFRAMHTAPSVPSWQAITPPWDPVDNNSSSSSDRRASMAAGVGIMAATSGDQYASRPRMSVPDFAPLDLGWSIAADSSGEHAIAPDSYFDHISTPESTDMASYTWSSVGQESINAFDHGSVSSCDDMPIPSHLGVSAHDCTRQAYEVMASLSFLEGGSNVHQPISPSSSPRNSMAQDASLDHILQVNNKAAEHLSALLSCASCMQSSHFVLLCASIISRLLTTYQQAAGVAGPTTAAAIGLSGEMIRAGHLIDQFGSQVSAASAAAAAGGGQQYMSDEFALGGQNNFLGHGLGSWLKSEHTSIGNMMGMKLTELNA